ncbi:MAG TPA: universal stress protein [Candidatus Dormibacteraeota bacterium]|nr:universal stress protein [Candidatus Dormibacteraeota bacterium]
MKAVAARKRIQLKNILFATDFSHAAAAALPFAAEIAQRFGAKLYAVHAKTPENYALPVTEVWPVANALLERETQELRQTLHNQFPGGESEVLTAEGGVWGVVEAAAAEKKADLIVVGTSGRRGIGKFILGSVAEEILRRATCPVLTVGPHSSCHPPREAKFRKIVYATDFGDGSPVAAAYAVALAQEHQAHLTLLHVIEHTKTGLVRPEELEKAALERLRDLLGAEAELWCEPRAIVRHGAAAEKILEVAEQDQADLIVLGVRSVKGVVIATHLSPAVAHRVISHALCPVLTVRA